MPTPPSTAELCAWARANGIQVADRGRLPADVLSAYRAAQNKPTDKRDNLTAGNRDISNTALRPRRPA